MRRRLFQALFALYLPLFGPLFTGGAGAGADRSSVSHDVTVLIGIPNVDAKSDWQTLEMDPSGNFNL